MVGKCVLYFVELKKQTSEKWWHNNQLPYCAIPFIQLFILPWVCCIYFSVKKDVIKQHKKFINDNFCETLRVHYLTRDSQMWLITSKGILTHSFLPSLAPSGVVPHTREAKMKSVYFSLILIILSFHQAITAGVDCTGLVFDFSFDGTKCSLSGTIKLVYNQASNLLYFQWEVVNEVNFTPSSGVTVHTLPVLVFALPFIAI